MMAGRLRECLKTLRWDASDLVATISCGTSEVAGWLDGRTKVPISVVAWLEALVKAHQTLPPSLSTHAKRTIEAADESLGLKARRHVGVCPRHRFSFHAALSPRNSQSPRRSHR
jgi:hypothetical protein